MRNAMTIGLAAIVLMMVSTSASAAMMDTSRTAHGHRTSYSGLRDDKPTMWHIFIRPSVTEVAWDRSWQFPESAFGNWVQTTQGHVMPAGRVNGVGMFVIYDMLVWEYVPTLLYLDVQDQGGREVVIRDPFGLDTSGLGVLPLFDVIIGDTPAQVIPEPGTAAVLVLGLIGLIFVTLSRNQRQFSRLA